MTRAELVGAITVAIEKSLQNARVSKAGTDFYAPEANAALAVIEAAGWVCVPKEAVLKEREAIAAMFDVTWPTPIWNEDDVAAAIRARSAEPGA